MVNHSGRGSRIIVCKTSRANLGGSSSTSPNPLCPHLKNTKTKRPNGFTIVITSTINGTKHSIRSNPHIRIPKVSRRRTPPATSRNGQSKRISKIRYTIHRSPRHIRSKTRQQRNEILRIRNDSINRTRRRPSTTIKSNRRQTRKKKTRKRNNQRTTSNNVNGTICSRRLSPNSTTRILIRTINSRTTRRNAKRHKQHPRRMGILTHRNNRTTSNYRALGRRTIRSDTSNKLRKEILIKFKYGKY